MIYIPQENKTKGNLAAVQKCVNVHISKCCKTTGQQLEGAIYVRAERLSTYTAEGMEAEKQSGGEGQKKNKGDRERQSENVQRYELTK